MLTFNARELASRRVEELNAELPNTFRVKFDDGMEIESTKRQVVYSAFFWTIHQQYPQTPLLFQHHVKSVLKDKPLNSSTHIQLLSNIFKSVVTAHQLHTPESQEHLLGLVYEVTNNVFNDVTKLAEEDVTSIDILDFIEVIEYPPIKAANESVQLEQEAIHHTYTTVLNVLNNDPNLSHNSLAKAIRSKMVNANQVCQCVSVRGFPTEVDGHIMPIPITSNYTSGMGKLYDFIAESRSAAKSLYFSEAPLQDAEYFARRLQLLCMVIERIHYVDCGSTKFIPWRITAPTLDEKGKVVYPGDLKFMIGKYYIDDATNQLKQITHDDPALYNQVLKIRSVVHCQHPDKHGVCEVCFGGLAKNVSRFANLGHLCAATMTQQTSQSVLSTKHLDASSVSSNIILSELAAKFFMTNRAKNAYILKKDWKDRNIQIVVNRDEAFGLTDIQNIDDVENINPLRVSSIEFIDIVYKEKGEEMTIPLAISQENRYAMLTTDFLRYLKLHRWDTDSRNNFVFNLHDWDFSLPVFQLPEMEYSYSDHSHQIAKIIESNMKNITDRSSPHSPISTLQELFTLVNTKLNVNIAALEVIIAATMIASRDNYELARNHPSPVLGIADLVIKNRSLSNSYAYEDQSFTLTSPRSFFKLGRPDSVFDAFLSPAEVVAHYKQKQM